MALTLTRENLDAIAAGLAPGATIADVAAALAAVATIREYEATPDLIERARSEHGTDEVEIDDDASTSPSDEGTWVSAWVWLEGVASEEEEDSEHA